MFKKPTLQEIQAYIQRALDKGRDAVQIRLYAYAESQNMDGVPTSYGLTTDQEFAARQEARRYYAPVQTEVLVNIASNFKTHPPKQTREEALEFLVGVEAEKRAANLTQMVAVLGSPSEATLRAWHQTESERAAEIRKLEERLAQLKAGR